MGLRPCRLLLKQGLGGGAIPRPPVPLSQPPRKCLWDLDIPWDRM